MNSQDVIVPVNMSQVFDRPGKEHGGIQRLPLLLFNVLALHSKTPHHHHRWGCLPFCSPLLSPTVCLSHMWCSCVCHTWGRPARRHWVSMASLWQGETQIPYVCSQSEQPMQSPQYRLLSDGPYAAAMPLIKFRRMNGLHVYLWYWRVLPKHRRRLHQWSRLPSSSYSGVFVCLSLPYLEVSFSDRREQIKR